MVSEYMYVDTPMCVCVRERERERERVYVCMCGCGVWSQLCVHRAGCTVFRMKQGLEAEPTRARVLTRFIPRLRVLTSVRSI